MTVNKTKGIETKAELSLIAFSLYEWMTPYFKYVDKKKHLIFSKEKKLFSVPLLLFGALILRFIKASYNFYALFYLFY